MLHFWRNGDGGVFWVKAIWRDLLEFLYGNLLYSFSCWDQGRWGTKDSIWWQDIINLGLVFDGLMQFLEVD